MIRVVTDHPIALTSNDHLYPRGTKIDNSGNWAFNARVRDLFGRASVLDLGCAGGVMVHSLLQQGHLAVGIEGSDYSQKHKRAQWKYLDGKYLFTADITKPFAVLEDAVFSRSSETLSKRLDFDVITMWEVIEHIKEDDLPQLFDNILLHLAPGGVVIMSVCPNPDRAYDDNQEINVDWKKHEGDPFAILEYFKRKGGGPGAKLIDYHMCCHDQPWWEAKMAKLRWFNNQGLVRQFKDCMVRGGDNAPGSFHMVLERG